MKLRHVFITLTAICTLQCLHADAESYSQLIEKGVYQEEVSGDLQAAIKTYEKIIETSKADQKIIAEAMYRMAHCYTRTGEMKKAKQLLNTLIAKYPEQKEYAAKAKDLIQETQQLVLHAAPWEDGETNRYRLLSPAGQEVGIMDGTIQKIEVNEREAWQVNYKVIAPVMQLRQYTEIVINKGDLKLIRADDQSTLTGRATSVNNNSVVTRKAQDNVSKISTGSLFYHKDQIPYLLRQASLKKGNEFTVTAYDPLSDRVLDTVIKVEGNETIEIAGKEFATQRVHLKIGSMNNSESFEDKAWISLDSDRRLLKYETQFATLVLDTTRKHIKPNRFTKAGSSITMQLPEGWSYYDASSLNPGFDVLAILLPDTFDIDAMFANKSFDGAQAGTITVQQVVDGDIHTLKGYFKNYTVKPGTRVEHKVSGLPAQTFAADYEFQNKSMVEYRTYILGKQNVYWFVFRVEKGRLAELKDRMDAAVAGFTAK